MSLEEIKAIAKGYEENPKSDLYRVLFDQSPDAVVVIDPDTTLPVQFNNKALELLGYSKEEFRALKITDYEADDNAKKIRGDIQNILRNGSAEFEKRFRTKTGRVLHVYISIKMIEVGGKKYLHNIYRDITERKQLAEERERVWNLSFDIFCIVDINGRFREVNPAFQRILGYESHEVLGKLFADFLHPEDVAATVREVQLHLKGHNTQNFENRYRCLDGSYRWLSWNAVVAPEGSMVYAVARDITDRKQVEEALRQSEDRFRTLFESATDGLFIIGFDGTLIDINKTAYEHLGFTKEEMLSMHLSHLDHPDFRDKMPQQIEHLQKHGWYVCESAHLRKDGSSMPVEINARIIDFEEKKVIFSIVRDITERKKLEEQLRQSQKMEAIGLLAGGIAHDFNNMLQAIVGYGNLLKAKVKDNGTLLEYVTEILCTSDRAAELTRGLLAYSRKQTLRLKPENLNEIVLDVAKLLQRVLGEDIELIVTPSPFDPVVLVDTSQIKQVLLNLATNARDAMPTGGKLMITINIANIDEQFVKEYNYDKAGTYVLLRVSDTGAGMNEQTRERIFEPFYTTKEVGRGTGLGLAIAYGVINQHNGYITCSSEPGNGTSFEISLPLVEQKRYEAATVALLEVPGGTETILLAEDNESVRKVMRSLLTDAGYTVIEAEDGEGATERFREHKNEIKLLLLDVIMPKRNGKEALEEIRKMHSKVRACFLSGYAEDVIESRTFPGEEFEFISKPVRPGELLRKIREILDS